MHALFPHQVWLPVDFPHKPLLHSVVTLLMFCIGLAVPASLLGATISRFLIGCFRVQRMAFSLLGTLSRWTGKPHTPRLFSSSTAISELSQWYLGISWTSGPYLSAFSDYRFIIQQMGICYRHMLCSHKTILLFKCHHSSLNGTVLYSKKMPFFLLLVGQLGDPPSQNEGLFVHKTGGQNTLDLVAEPPFLLIDVEFCIDNCLGIRCSSILPDCALWSA